MSKDFIFKVHSCDIVNMKRAQSILNSEASDTYIFGFQMYDLKNL